MKNQTIQQFELAGSEQVFNLASETAVDGERLQCEREAEARNREAARQLEQKQQPNLF